MTPVDLQQKLSDLIGFQCALVALRGVGAESSEEMLWHTLLSELVQQYSFRRAWYGRSVPGGIRPLVLAPVTVEDLDVLPVRVEESSPLVRNADLMLPVSVEGVPEGRLLIDSNTPVSADRAEQVRILTSEATTMLAERRFRQRSQEALRRAKIEAESANRAKSLLLANMSHEIRTPMTGVLGFADLLVDTPLTAEQLDYVETIRSCGTALLTLINDILDFSKLEAGKFQLESRPVDIRSTVEKAIGLLAVQAAEKRLRLSFHVDAATPEAVLGDGVRVRQVLMNLLGNAVKFTSTGEVVLTVKSRLRDDGRHQVEFAVRDTGPGIAPADQKRVFESFSQVDASISRKHGGTGLGLAISKSLAEQMDGSLRVESELGHGATFYFTVVAQACVAAHPPAASAAGKRVPAPELPSLRIVVADDNEVNRRAALELLHLLGYQPDSVANGVDLLAKLRETRYDVVFMDVQMPELDGLEATRRIRREFPLERQPRIIALTAAAFPEDRARCLDAGMDDYIAKPLDLVELTGVLLRARPEVSV